jgi:hypothetical protein
LEKNNKIQRLEGTFTENLRTEYPFLKEDQQGGKELCTIWKSLFSAGYGSHSDVQQHRKKKKKSISLL